MEYNIVTNYKIIQIFKSNSKYFKVNLGLSSTKQNSNGDRVLNDKDDFAFHYNTLYKANILGQGNIGNIKFYTDHYIKEDKIAFYYDKEEFIFIFDPIMVKERGIDIYLGHLIKNIETEQQDRLLKKQKVIEEQKQIVGNANNIFDNPGSVRYADLKAYLDKKASERLIVDKQ